MSASAACVALRLWTMPRRSVPMWNFMPKCQFLPFPVCFISGSRDIVTFFVELGATMIVTSTIVPARKKRWWASSRSLITSKIDSES